MTSERYRAAGVDIDAAQRAKGRILKHARSTFGPQVMGGIGFFGGLYHLEGFRDPVLVSSTDGVGTKLKVAALAGRYDTIGVDLVNHCVNDIFTCGARPLFFLDYIGTGRLVPEQAEELAKGMAAACREAGCALIGGETAEMPGLYAPGDFDLVGFIVGAVERDAVLDGSSIGEGDILVGMPSSGLHTNGYSLVRRAFALDGNPGFLQQHYQELGTTLGEALLVPHRAYYPMLKPVLPLIRGMAHITGGGLLENVPRVLPKGLAAFIDKGSWEVPPLFRLIQRRGDVSEAEMYRVFNMGVGMALVCEPSQVNEVLRRVPGAWVCGEVVRAGAGGRVRLE